MTTPAQQRQDTLALVTPAVHSQLALVSPPNEEEEEEEASPSRQQETERDQDFQRRLFALALGFLFFRLVYTWSRRAFLFVIASLIIAIAAAVARQFIMNNNPFMAQQRYYHPFQMEGQLAQQNAQQQQQEEEQLRRLRMERIERERKESEAMAQEAATLMMEINRQHLQEFINNAVGDGGCCTATYEQWIAELHPENITAESTAAAAADALSVDDNDGDDNGQQQNQPATNTAIHIDHRFYLLDSDHRLLWNEVARQEDGHCLEPVAARSSSLAPSSS